VSGLSVLFRKEFSDALRSRRFWVVVGIFLALYVTQVYFVYQNFRLLQTSTGVRLFLSIGQGIAEAVQLAAPLLGVALGFAAVSGERERGTLRLILARPVYRDTVVTSKMLAALAVTAFSMTVASLLAVATAAFLGVGMEASDVLRLLVFTLLAVLYTMAYYSISLFISVLSRRSSHSLLLSLGVWAFFTIVLPIVATLVAYAVIGPPPLPANATALNVTQIGEAYANWTAKAISISFSMQFFSPNQRFSDIVNPIFGTRFTVRTEEGGRVTIGYEFGEFNPLEELARQWTGIAVLLLYPAVFLTASYMAFVARQEK